MKNADDACSLGKIYTNLNVIVSQSCTSDQAFTVGPGSGLSLSKYFGPIWACNTKLFTTFRVTIFIFRDVQLLCSSHWLLWEKWLLISLQLILFANAPALFCSLLGSVSHSFWEGESGQEISTRWLCFEKINLWSDSWLVLRNDSLQTGFSCLWRNPG